MRRTRKHSLVAAAFAGSSIAVLFAAGCGGRDDDPGMDEAAVVPPVGSTLDGARAAGGQADPAAGVPDAVAGGGDAILDMPTELYEVQQGDTLWEIADAHGTSVGTLQKLNGIEGSFIRFGQKIKVPAPPAAAPPASGGAVAEPTPTAPDAPGAALVPGTSDTPPTTAPVAPRPALDELAPKPPPEEPILPTTPAGGTGGTGFGFGGESAPRSGGDDVIELTPGN